MTRYTPRGALRHNGRPSRLTMAAAMIVAAAVTMTGCVASANPGPGGSADGASITILSPDQGMGFQKEAGSANNEFLGALHATLVRKPYVDTSREGVQQQDLYEYEPYLADSYEVSGDGLTYTFSLSDAVSAAGNELTADDVLWSFELKFNVPTSSAPGAMKPVITDPATQIEKIDEKTVAFTMPRAGMGMTFLALMSDALSLVYDSTLLKEHATADDPYAIEWALENPNYGFGPYEVTNYTESESARFEAREDWVGGEIDVQTVEVRVVPDAGSRASTIRAGDADIAQGLSPADREDLSSAEDLLIPEVDLPNNFLMLPLVTNKAPFDDLKVRQAFAYAVPYDQIMENVYHGRAVRQGPGFVLKSAPGYTDAGFPDFKYDPEKALALLEEAGRGDGVAFTLSVSSSDPDGQAAAVQIQTAARDAGFDISIETAPVADFLAARNGKQYQALILQNSAFTLTPMYELNLWTARDSSNNYGDWVNDAFNTAFDAATQIADQSTEEAGAAWNAAERIFVEQTPILFIAQTQPGIALSTAVDGYAWRSDGTIDYSHLSITK